MLNGKPASLVTRVDGTPVSSPDAPHCAAVGAALGRLHVASATYRARLTNRRGPRGGDRPRARSARSSTPAQNELLAAELKFLTGFAKVRMPRGAIHGDLFCDNVLFVGDRVSGIIDFGFAATDFLAYDLAITVNDWCIVKDGADTGALVPELVAALVGAYDAVRPLTADERAQWPALLRAAALRFWLSRLYDLHLPRPGELVHAHDPAHFERILRDRIARARRLAGARAGSHTGTGDRDHELSHRPRSTSRVISGRRGVIWLKEAAGDAGAARVPWLMLLLAYYLIQLLVSVVPLVGPLAMMVLRPVFTVGFLAAAWTQERGGQPEIRHLFRGFRTNLWALLPIGVVLIAGTTLAVLATALVDGGALLDAITSNARPDEALAGESARRSGDAVRDRLRAPRRCSPMWFAPALVVFQDCGPRQAMVDEPARGARQLAPARRVRPAALLLRRGAAGNRHRADRAAWCRRSRRPT